ncbi:lipopolysaccharide biosynthesis protein [Solibacillus silvestris]|uniref:lipopolysaccharide biosynthesis protein n=1 Tax=Solibacillus silvestris TaxID=76853 RepID=UPI003F81F9D5
MSKIKEIMNSFIVKSVMKVASGTALAQLIALLLIPFITKIYGSESYGIMGVYISFLTLLTSIVALTLPKAIVLPKKIEEAQALTALSFRIIVFMTSLSFILLLFTKEKLINILGIESIGNWILLIPLAAFFSGVLQIVQQWTIRENQFGIFAKTAVYQSLYNHGGKVLAGWIAPLSANLIVISSVVDLVRANIMMKAFKKKRLIDFGFLRKNERDNRELLKKYKDFPLYQAPEEFIDAISQGVPVIILTSFFGPMSAGFYTLSRTVISAPSSLLGSAINDVYYPRLAQALQSNEPLKPILVKATKTLLLVGAVPYAILFVFSPPLFEAIFGTQWRTAGEYSRWLVLWIYIMFANGPCVKALIVMGEQKWSLKFSVITLIFRLIILIIGAVLFKDELIAIILFSVLGFIVNVSFILQTFIKAKYFDERRGMDFD